jgi:hypothetical protein
LGKTGLKFSNIPQRRIIKLNLAKVVQIPVYPVKKSKKMVIRNGLTVHAYSM